MNSKSTVTNIQVFDCQRDREYVSTSITSGNHYFLVENKINK